MNDNFYTLYNPLEKFHIKKYIFLFYLVRKENIFFEMSFWFETELRKNNR